MISFPRCIAINLNPAVFASCRQLNDVILMIIREWCIFICFNALESYCTRPPREPIRMTDVVSGGLQEDALLLFGKEEMGPHLLGHRGIRRKAVSQLRFLTVNIWKCPCLCSLSEGLGVISYREISRKPLIGIFILAWLDANTWRQRTRAKVRRLAAVCWYFFLAYCA